MITERSPQAPILHGKGPTVITGLAWSGQGIIPRVDVTIDGGVNWHRTRVDGPSLDKSLHRFYFEFDWDGKPLLLQSRAHDTTGYVQPTKDALRKIRARFQTIITTVSRLGLWKATEWWKMSKFLNVAVIFIFFSAPAIAGEIGRIATPDEVSAWDIDIRPDGLGLPEGSGTVAQGEVIFEGKCAACHGDFGEGVGRWPVLAGGVDTLASDRPLKTVRSFWPYLSTVWDYIHRAMHFGDAQSLSADEVYARTAYIMYLNDIVDNEAFELSKANFLDFPLGNEGGFYPDDRPDTEYPFFTDACMSGCKSAVETTKRASGKDVTPE